MVNRAALTRSLVRAHATPPRRSRWPSSVSPAVYFWIRSARGVKLHEVACHGEQGRFDPLLGTRPRYPAQTVEVAIVGLTGGVFLDPICAWREVARGRLPW